MIIFIDFDDVLFNTKLFKRKLIKVFLANGISRKDFFESYYDYPFKTKKGLKKYDPWQQIKALKEKYNLEEKKLIKDLENLLRNSKEFLFFDSKDFLKKFDKDFLILLSYGDNKFQEEKVKGSGLARYFFKIIIGDEDKAKLIQRFLVSHPPADGAGKKDPIFLLEDFPMHINVVKRKLPHVKIIRIKRRDGRYGDLPSLKPDFEAKNFKEAGRIIHYVSLQNKSQITPKRNYKQSR